MRVLITGGAGFLGSHLCDRFLAEGHTVIAMDNLITGSTDNISHLLGNERFTFVKHNVSNYIYFCFLYSRTCFDYIFFVLKKQLFFSAKK